MRHRRGTGRIAASVALLALGLVLVSSERERVAADAPGVTERVSIDSDEKQVARGGANPSISADGRFVAFESTERIDLVRDSNQVSDIYVRDRMSGTTALASEPLGGPGASTSGYSNPSISATGQFIAFDTAESSPPDAFRSVFVSDRGLPSPDGSFQGIPQVTFVQRGGNDGDYSTPSISGDGSQIAFQRTCRPGETQCTRDGILISNRDQKDANGDGIIDDPVTIELGPGALTRGLRQPAISADGVHVAYLADVCYQGCPVGLATPRYAQTVLIYDRGSRGALDQPGVAAYRAVNAAQVASSPTDDSRGEPAVSGDGSVVSYTFNRQIYVAERGPSGQFREPPTLLSQAPNGTPGNSFSSNPAVSADGRYLAFETRATNLHPSVAEEYCGDVNRCADILVVDRLAFVRPLELVSVSALAAPFCSVPNPGPVGCGDSLIPALSGNGRFIAFQSAAPNLIPSGEDSNDEDDAFVRELTPTLVGAPDPLDFGGAEVGTSSLPLSATFSHIGFGPLTITGVAITGGDAGDFEVFPPPSLCANAILHRPDSCAVSVRFRPSAPGTRSSRLVVSYGGPRGTTSSASVGLVGGGDRPPVPVFLARPNPVSFGDVLVGTSSPVKVVTVTNVGTPVLSIPTFKINAISIAGAQPGDFAVTATTCIGTTLAAGATCTVDLRYTPTAPGSRTATLVFGDTAPGAPHLVGLEGTAPAPVVVVSPGVGVPGSVLTVTGRNWPPGAPVTLAFDRSPAITRTVPAETGATAGQFRTSLLIFPRSEIGPRSLSAFTTLPAPVGSLSAGARFLVTAPSVDGGNDFVFRH